METNLPAQRYYTAKDAKAAKENQDLTAETTTWQSHNQKPNLTTEATEEHGGKPKSNLTAEAAEENAEKGLISKRNLLEKHDFEALAMQRARRPVDHFARTRICPDTNL